MAKKTEDKGKATKTTKPKKAAAKKPATSKGGKVSKDTPEVPKEDKEPVVEEPTVPASPTSETPNDPEVLSEAVDTITKEEEAGPDELVAPTDTELDLGEGADDMIEDVPAKVPSPLEQMLDEYIVACAACNKEADKKGLIKRLSAIIRQALANNDADSANMLLKFIGENKNKIMHESNVFQMIRILDIGERKPVESCYTFLVAAIAKLTKKEKFRLDIGAVRATLNADEFVNTIVAKLER